MAKAVRILILEDYPPDAELNRYEVKKALPQSQFKIVDTKEEYIDSLSIYKPDIILSDYRLPGFDGMEALRIKNERAPDIPFILITGPMNEEIAVECMKAGAWDYVLKDRYMRIGPAVVNALEQKNLKEESKNALLSLQESEARYRSLVMYSPDAIYVDTDERIVLVNQECVRLFHAKSEKDLIGKSPFELFYVDDHKEIRNRMHQLRDLGKPVPVRTEKIIRFDGKVVDVDVLAAPFQLSGVNAIHVILRDITERKIAEEKLKASLNEKETLLQEIYHRTKNNMQVISSLLELQAVASDNEEVKRMLHDSTTRIRTMALAQEKLYESRKLSHVNMREYITELVKLLETVNKTSGKNIEITFDIVEIECLIDIAIPCGLIINEILSNSFKYAFPNERNGKIYIGLHRKNSKHLELTIGDNGVSLPADYDITKARTLGINLISQIARHQLHGAASVDRENGVWWHILFREDVYRERV